MERNQRNLEAQSAEEEDHAHDRQWRGTNVLHDIIKVECARSTIKEADTVDHHTTGESSGEDELCTGLCTVMTILVESDKAGHRHRSHLKTDEEQQEVVGTYHHVHTEKRRDDEFVELSFLEISIWALQPLARLDEDNKRTKGENRLDDAHARIGHIHTTESSSRSRGENVDEDMSQHQHTHQRIEPAAHLTLTGAGSSEQVSKEYDQQNSRQRGLRNHIKKLTIIYIHNFILFSIVLHASDNTCAKDMMQHRSHGIVDDILCPQWSHTKAGYAENQAAYSDTLVP